MVPVILKYKTEEDKTQQASIGECLTKPFNVVSTQRVDTVSGNPVSPCIIITLHEGEYTITTTHTNVVYTMDDINDSLPEGDTDMLEDVIIDILLSLRNDYF